MPRRASTRILRVLVVALLVLPACSSGDDGGDAAPPATGPDATSSPTGPSPDPETTGAPLEIDACSLITQEDAEIALGAEVDEVEDPFGEGLVTEDPGEIAGACGFRPSGVDDGRVVAIGVAAPGSITPEEFDELTEGGIQLGGPGDEATRWAVVCSSAAATWSSASSSTRERAWTPTARSPSSSPGSRRSASRRVAEV